MMMGVHDVFVKSRSSFGFLLLIFGVLMVDTITAQIYLAGIYDQTAFWWGEDIFRITVDLYNEGFFNDEGESLTAQSFLVYELADSACDETEAIRTYWDLRTANSGVPMDGVVGTRCSGSSLSLARLTGVEEVAQVSPSATSGKLSDKDRYPFFSRLVAPHDETGEAGAMVALLRAFGWDRITILTADTQFSKDWATDLRKIWTGPHNDETGSWTGEVIYSDTIRVDAVTGTIDQESIEQTLANIPTDPRSNSRVIVLPVHNTDAFPILKTAREMSFQPETIWVGPSAWIGRDDVGGELDWLPPYASPGWIGLAPLRNDNEYAEAFKKKVEDELEWTDLPTYAAEMVDSIVLLAKAIDIARTSPGKDATTVLRDMVYERGISGRVEFTASGDRKDPQYSVLNYGPNGWKEVGVASPKVGSASIQEEDICWASLGCSVQEVPSDKYPVPKQKLPVWVLVLIPIICLALLAIAFKYWRSHRRKDEIRRELATLQKSVVGMRAAATMYIPTSILENDNMRMKIDTSGNSKVSSLVLSCSLKADSSLVSKAQWYWKETSGFVDRHDPSQVLGDGEGWIKYDEFSNNTIEAAYMQQQGKGTVSLDPYVIDFDTNLQTKQSTGFQREVKRVAGNTKDDSLSMTDTDPSISQSSTSLPRDLCKEPQIVLLAGDVVQISKHYKDSWAFGTKLFHADEIAARELVEITMKDNDVESIDGTNLCADAGWFPLDITRVPTPEDLAGLQKNVGDAGELNDPNNWEDIVDPEVVQRHSLNSSSQEYQRISSAFLNSLNDGQVKILQIERIQNRALWQSYVVKRQTICNRETKLKGEKADSKDASIIRQRALQRFERCWLYHASKKEDINKIIQQGFNRSFCGKNATMYGKGVYFARDSSYSASRVYSVPDKKGNQYMMACRVVVGEYCRGKKDAVVPDVRDTRSHTLYDTTVGLLGNDTMRNPSIYVTYHDAQAYPEYIIKFKTKA